MSALILGSASASAEDAWYREAVGRASASADLNWYNAMVGGTAVD